MANNQVVKGDIEGISSSSTKIGEYAEQLRETLAALKNSVDEFTDGGNNYSDIAAFSGKASVAMFEVYEALNEDLLEYVMVLEELSSNVKNSGQRLDDLDTELSGNITYVG